MLVRTEILIDISKFLRCLGFSLIYNSISRSYFLISTKNRSVFRTQSNINDTVSSYISEGNFPSSKKKKNTLKKFLKFPQKKGFSYISGKWISFFLLFFYFFIFFFIFIFFFLIFQEINLSSPKIKKNSWQNFPSSKKKKKRKKRKKTTLKNFLYFRRWEFLAPSLKKSYILSKSNFSWKVQETKISCISSLEISSLEFFHKNHQNHQNIFQQNLHCKNH